MMKSFERNLETGMPAAWADKYNSLRDGVIERNVLVHSNTRNTEFMITSHLRITVVQSTMSPRR